MAEKQLQKPLYKPTPKPGETEAPPMRGPKPSIVARSAAVLADLLILHFVCVLLIKLFPGAVAGLGPYSRIFGVLLAVVYVGIGSSRMVFGRTFGKLLTRVQVLKLDQSELSPAAGIQRAAVLLWPLAIVAIITPMLDSYYHESAFDKMAMAFYLGNFLALAWVAGNFIHIAVHPYKRSLVDVIMGSMVANTDGDPEETREWYSGARTLSAETRWNRQALFTAVMTMAFVFGLGGMLAFQARKMIEDQSAPALRMQAFLQNLKDESFGLPYLGPSANPERIRTLMNSGEGTTWSLPLTAQYWVRNNLSADDPEVARVTAASLARLEELASDPASESLINELIGMVAQERRRSQESVTSAPANLYLETSVAENADLLFARDRLVIYSRGKLVDIATSNTVPMPE